MEWFLLVTLAVLAVGGVAAMFNLHGLKSKFANLGTLSGRTKAEIIAAVGQPSSVSSTGDGKTLLQWQHVSEAGGYHIALLFDAHDICEGVTHESSSNAGPF